MGTSREGLLNNNRAEITSFPNQDYFWGLLWGLVEIFFLYIFSPLKPRGSEYITQCNRMHYTHLC